MSNTIILIGRSGKSTLVNFLSSGEYINNLYGLTELKENLENIKNNKNEKFVIHLDNYKGVYEAIESIEEEVLIYNINY